MQSILRLGLESYTACAICTVMSGGAMFYITLDAM